MVIAVIVAIAFAGLAILLVMAIGLYRHVKLLAGSLTKLQRDLQPLLEDIQAGAMTAQQRTERMSERRPGRERAASSEDLGAKLRS